MAKEKTEVQAADGQAIAVLEEGLLRLEFPQDEEVPLVERYVEVMQLYETEGFSEDQR